jgi:hypothetical protein
MIERGIKMAKIKITQQGWEGYTGLFGRVEFVDGVSADDVCSSEINNFAAILSVEIIGEFETDAEKRIRGDFTVETKEARTLTQEELLAEREAEAKQKPVQDNTKRYSREQLEQIADKEGLAGLRKVSVDFGVTDRSVPSLIAKILKTQAELDAIAKKD